MTGYSKFKLDIGKDKDLGGHREVVTKQKKSSQAEISVHLNSAGGKSYHEVEWEKKECSQC